VTIESDRHDEAMRPVREAGGGEAEGFEEAEELLRRRAEHDEPSGGDPLEDRPDPEPDRDRAAHGEPDRIESTETEADTPRRR
jgi:hypothetical protein